MARLPVFLDSAGFLALWDSSDQHHPQAVRVQRDLHLRGHTFFTTDYVADETITLLRIRHSHAAACDFLQTLHQSRSIRLRWTDPARFSKAGDIFRKHRDKEWSFTDCVSFLAMREQGAKSAFTTDHHFRQAGFQILLG
jgi:predicted nucleic acid-binding protein